MSLRLWYRSPPGAGAWTESDLTVDRACEFKLTIGYSHPATLEWTMYDDQHARPIPYLADICFVDTAHYDPTPLTNPDTFTDPLFLGHVKTIDPVASSQLRYTAMDPTDRAGQELIILSGASSTVPRLVYNAIIETDDDYAFSRDLQATVEDMIRDILGDRTSQLQDLMAAPSSGFPYVAADLANLTLMPQEKVVFETEGVRAGLDRLLQWYPAYRIVFDPAGRQWRFRKVNTATQVTLTLNQHSSGGRNVLTMDLQRSIEQRYTAVEIHGPLKPHYGRASVSPKPPGGIGPADTTHGLDPLWNATDEALVIAAGPDILDADKGKVFRIYQVAEAEARALTSVVPVRLLAGFSDVGRAGNNGDQFRIHSQPQLLASYDQGVTYETVNGIEIDRANGIVRAPRTIIRHTGSAWIGPDNVVFDFGYFASELTARAPLAGYEGTANSDLGLERTLLWFDESLTAGYDKNDTFISEAERVAQFEVLAQNILEAHQDVIYAGGCVIAGLDYEFARLTRRINLAAVDGDGDALTTGWEAIDAVLTDVEYDYEQRLTTLTFSGDHLEFILADPDLLKERLKIWATTPNPSGFFIEATLDGQFLFRSSILGGSEGRIEAGATGG